MLHMKGHVNSFSTALGMDVWEDEVVAIGAFLLKRHGRSRRGSVPIS